MSYPCLTWIPGFTAAGGAWHAFVAVLLYCRLSVNVGNGNSSKNGSSYLQMYVNNVRTAKLKIVTGLLTLKSLQRLQQNSTRHERK